jgi:hypothetical protein
MPGASSKGFETVSAIEAQRIVALRSYNVLDTICEETFDWHVTASVGAVTFVDPPRDETTALKVADICMYTAKSMGRNRIMFHEHITLRASDPVPDGVIGWDRPNPCRFSIPSIPS